MNRLSDYLFNLEIGSAQVEKQIGIHATQAYKAVNNGDKRQANKELTKIQHLAKENNLRHRRNIQITGGRQSGGGRKDNDYGKLPEPRILKTYDLPDSRLAGFSGRSNKKDTDTDETETDTDETETDTDETETDTEETDMDTDTTNDDDETGVESNEADDEKDVKPKETKSVKAKETKKETKADYKKPLPTPPSKQIEYSKLPSDFAPGFPLAQFYLGKVSRDKAIDHLKKNPKQFFVLREVSTRADFEPEIQDRAKRGFKPYVTFTTLRTPTKDDPRTEAHVIIYINDKGEISQDGKDKHKNLVTYLKAVKHLPKDWK